MTATLSSGKQFSVAAIESGTVLDHIESGQAISLLRLLKLDCTTKKIFVGMNLPSSLMGSKDLIKVDGWELSPSLLHSIAVFAPRTTVSIIQNYEVIKKFSVELPKEIRGAMICPNKNCITNYETVMTQFTVASYKKSTQLTCCFCEHSYTPLQIKFS